jgi:hypothetical protein
MIPAECHLARAFACGLLAMTLVACDDTAPEPISCIMGTEPTVIASASLWQAVDPSDDPFYGLTEGDPVLCAPIQYGPEYEAGVLWFGIDTHECGYLTVSQQLLEPLCPGDQVELRLWHFSLTQGDYVFEAAFSLGHDAPDWQVSIPVPSDGALVVGDWIVDRHIDAGESFYFHLSNHGNNSWGLMDITATRDDSV